MNTRLGTLTIHYQVSSLTHGGDLEDTQTFRVSEEILGIGFGAASSSTLSPAARERLAAAAHRYSKLVGLRAGTLTLQIHSRAIGGGNTHYCSGDNVVIEMTPTKQWGFLLCTELLHAKDVLEGRFPSVHPAARVRWVETMRALSVEGRLADRGIERVAETHGSRITPPPVLASVRRNLLDTLIWTGKGNGLSIRPADAQRMADALWGNEVTLRQIVALGNRFGLRLEGPLASIPLTDDWRTSKVTKCERRETPASEEIPVA